MTNITVGQARGYYCGLDVFNRFLYVNYFSTVWQQLLMNCLIGLAVGLIGALLHQTIDLISDFKWLWAKQYLHEYTQVIRYIG